MRILLLFVATLLAGLLFGAGSTWLELGRADAAMGPRGADAQIDRDLIDQNLDPRRKPRVEFVGPSEFDFGSMEKGVTLTHRFIIKNTGNAPLQLLQNPKTTCSCTVGTFSKKSIGPGETAEIELSWTAQHYAELYRQAATIFTNDPDNRLIGIAVVGRVTEAVRAWPSDVVFTRVTAGEEKTVSVDLLSYRDRPLNIERMELIDDRTAPYFDLKTEPLDAEAMASYSGAFQGLKLSVTVKPGIPLGPIHQQIRVTTDYEGVEPVDIPIYGRVTSDISLIGGSRFNSEHNLLDLGTFAGNQGADETLHILVKGEGNERTELKIAQIDPAELIQAEIGPPKSLNNGAVLMYPLSIKVKSGAPVTLKLGPKRGGYASILIQTNHPNVPEVPLYVRFAIEE